MLIFWKKSLDKTKKNNKISNGDILKGPFWIENRYKNHMLAATKSD